MESRFQDFVERPVLEMHAACGEGREVDDPVAQLQQLLRDMQVTSITGGTLLLMHMCLDDATLGRD